MRRFEGAGQAQLAVGLVRRRTLPGSSATTQPEVGWECLPQVGWQEVLIQWPSQARPQRVQENKCEVESVPSKTPRRRVFFSFHYDRDNWRTSQVRNIGAIQGSKPVDANAWEEVKRRGDFAIREWIDARIDRGSCVIVLVGSETADREWVRYEIERAWTEGKGLLGIYIHNLRDMDGKQSRKGRNPFEIDVDGVRLSDHVKVHDPRTRDSQRAYGHIAEHIEGWVEEAVRDAEGRRRARREAASRSWLSRLLGMR